MGEILYFRLARKLNIIDRPNQRSSHSTPTTRGGGVIFPISFLIATFIAPFDGWMYCVIGLICIAFISFVDDIKSVDSRIRFFIQGCAIALMLWQYHPLHAFATIVSFFIFIGVINIYNFMDGINGITALYSIVTVASFVWISNKIVFLLPNMVFISLLAALIVFSFFNLRKKARCFSGDVGAISMAYVIILLLILCYKATGSLSWLALVSVYLIDGIFTIFARIRRRENIFKAHRSHFYQYLANEKSYNHLIVSALYAFTQLLVNIVLILEVGHSPVCIILTLFLLFVIYIIFRLRFEGKKRLFHKY